VRKVSQEGQLLVVLPLQPGELVRLLATNAQLEAASVGVLVHEGFAGQRQGAVERGQREQHLACNTQPYNRRTDKIAPDKIAPTY